jgi:hypothetical protein
VRRAGSYAVVVIVVRRGLSLEEEARRAITEPPVDATAAGGAAATVSQESALMDDDDDRSDPQTWHARYRPGLLANVHVLHVHDGRQPAGDCDRDELIIMVSTSGCFLRPSQSMPFQSNDTSLSRSNSGWAGVLQNHGTMGEKMFVHGPRRSCPTIGCQTCFTTL